MQTNDRASGNGSSSSGNGSHGNRPGSEGTKSRRHIFGSGVDPVEAGRKGGLARMQSTTPEQRSAMARNAQAAQVIKRRKRLLAISGEAIEKLYDVLMSPSTDAPSIIAAVKTILDRAGIGPKSAIEIDQEINLTGSINHEFVPRSDLIDPDKLPLIVLRMMLASIQEEWEPSSELTEAIRAELPMMRVEIESSKPGKPAKQLSGVVVGVGVPAIPGASGK